MAGLSSFPLAAKMACPRADDDDPDDWVSLYKKALDELRKHPEVQRDQAVYLAMLVLRRGELRLGVLGDAPVGVVDVEEGGRMTTDHVTESELFKELARRSAVIGKVPGGAELLAKLQEHHESLAELMRAAAGPADGSVESADPGLRPPESGLQRNRGTLRPGDLRNGAIPGARSKATAAPPPGGGKGARPGLLRRSAQAAVLAKLVGSWRDSEGSLAYEVSCDAQTDKFRVTTFKPDGEEWTTGDSISAKQDLIGAHGFYVSWTSFGTEDRYLDLDDFLWGGRIVWRPHVRGHSVSGRQDVVWVRPQQEAGAAAAAGDLT